jgi:hypothetical protein
VSHPTGAVSVRALQEQDQLVSRANECRFTFFDAADRLAGFGLQKQIVHYLKPKSLSQMTLPREGVTIRAWGIKRVTFPR